MSDFNETEFEAALSSFRFDEAAAMLSTSSMDSAERVERINASRAAAEERAQRLHGTITELARQHDHRSLIRIADDAETPGLLSLLPPSTRERSEVQLAAAGRWADSRREANRRRVAEAEQALKALDLDLAKALLLRIESTFLFEEDQAWRDRLLLEMEARSMEFEDLPSVSDLSPPESERQKWWKRHK